MSRESVSGLGWMRHSKGMRTGTSYGQMRNRATGVRKRRRVNKQAALVREEEEGGWRHEEGKGTTREDDSDWDEEEKDEGATRRGRACRCGRKEAGTVVQRRGNSSRRRVMSERLSCKRGQGRGS
jgi:hypothetical protein